MDKTITAEAIIDLLDLEPHPEGGFFRETFRHAHPMERAVSTAIYFLIVKDKPSHWHRIDTAEVWHHYAGAPLKLSISEDGKTQKNIVVGPNLFEGERPQGVVPSRAWQAAETSGNWTLVGCTVAPGFDFGHFELAPPDWRPGD